MIISILAIFTRLLSSLTGFIVSLSQPAFIVSAVISLYSQIYGVDLKIASKDIKEYSSLSDFFLRDLKPGSRPIPENSEGMLLSPVDGTLREVIRIEEHNYSTVKGVRWEWDKLLVSAELKQRYMQGLCFNMYLSPADYHHVHTAISADLKQVIHQPGTLLPVNDWTLKMVPNLFSLNERAILVMQAGSFEYLLVFVGALNVGSIKLEALPQFQRSDFSLASTNYQSFTKSQFNAGEKLGSFALGSSVLLILPPQAAVNLDVQVKEGQLTYGQVIARNLPK